MNQIETFIFSKLAAREFVQNGVSLDRTIAKIAEDRDLNPIHIQRLVEAANHTTNDELRKVSADKTFTFNLASLPGVLSIITGNDSSDVGIPVVKVAEAINAVISRANKIQTPTSDNLLKVAEKKKKTKQLELTAKKGIAKCAKFKKQLEVARTVLSERVSEETEKLAADVRYFVLREKGDIKDLYKFASIAIPGHDKECRQLFFSVYNSLEKVAHPTFQRLATVDEIATEDKRLAGVGAPSSPVIQITNGSEGVLKKVKSIYELLTNIRANSEHQALLTNMIDMLERSVDVIHNNEDVGQTIEDATLLKAAACVEACDSLDEAVVTIKKLAGVIEEQNKKLGPIRKQFKKITAPYMPYQHRGIGTPPIFSTTDESL